MSNNPNRTVPPDAVMAARGSGAVCDGDRLAANAICPRRGGGVVKA